MSPLSREDLVIKITECITKIQHLENDVKELRKEVRNRKKENVESQRYISNRRLAIYLVIASIFGGIIVEVVKWLISLAP